MESILHRVSITLILGLLVLDLFWKQRTESRTQKLAFVSIHVKSCLCQLCFNFKAHTPRLVASLILANRRVVWSRPLTIWNVCLLEKRQYCTVNADLTTNGDLRQQKWRMVIIVSFTPSLEHLEGRDSNTPMWRLRSIFAWLEFCSKNDMYLALPEGHRRPHSS